MKVYYDPKVEELARLFLDSNRSARDYKNHRSVYSVHGTAAGVQDPDATPRETRHEREAHEDRVTRLSRQIQQTIEEFLKFDW